MEWFAKAIEFLKLPLKYIWGVAIAAGLLLFLPASALERLRVAQFTKDYGSYIGVVFVVSLVLAGVHTVVAVSHFFSRKRRVHKFKTLRTEALHNLDPQEKAVLREFFVQEQNTIRLPIDHPTVAGMRTKGILLRVGQHGEGSLAGILFPLKMADDIRGQLTASMIDLPEGEPSKEQIDWVVANRPDFIPEIERHVDLFHRSWRGLW